MVIETKRLTITTASQEEMICFIEEQTDEILIKAYREMLQGCLDHPDHWDWYAIWFIKTKCGFIPSGIIGEEGPRSSKLVDIFLVFQMVRRGGL